MKYLVTGGCGFIGSHIVDRLILEGNEVVVIDDLSAPQNKFFYFNDRADYHELDISCQEAGHLFKDVDVVYHLAARSRIQPTINNPNECFVVNGVVFREVSVFLESSTLKLRCKVENRRLIEPKSRLQSKSQFGVLRIGRV